MICLHIVASEVVAGVWSVLGVGSIMSVEVGVVSGGRLVVVAGKRWWSWRWRKRDGGVGDGGGVNGGGSSGGACRRGCSSGL